MDREQAKEFIHRWQVADEVHWREVRLASPELRWRQLNALYCMARTLKLIAKRRDGAGGYELWARLKEKAARASGA